MGVEVRGPCPICGRERRGTLHWQRRFDDEVEWYACSNKNCGEPGLIFFFINKLSALFFWWLPEPPVLP